MNGALAKIDAWVNDPAVLEDASRASLRRFEATRKGDARQLQVLLVDLIGGINANGRSRSNTPETPPFPT